MLVSNVLNSLYPAQRTYKSYGYFELNIFVMHDEPHYSPDGWLGKESQEGQVRFMLSKRKESPYSELLTANTNMTPIVCSRTLVTARWVLTAASSLTRIKIVSDILINAKDRSLY